MSSEESKSNILAFMLGGVVGAGIALVFAPRSGKETREHLRGYAKDIEGKVIGKISDFKETATQEYDIIKEKAHSAVEEGRKAVIDGLKKEEKEEEV